MNMSLSSDPYRIPDRINSTLNLPIGHPQIIKNNINTTDNNNNTKTTSATSTTGQQQRSNSKSSSTNNNNSSNKVAVVNEDNEDNETIDNNDDNTLLDDDVYETETVGTATDDHSVLMDAVDNSNTNCTTATTTTLLSSSSSCSVSFNKRGSYIAVGYNTGSLAIFDFISRSLVSFCYPDGYYRVEQQNNYDNSEQGSVSVGFNSISWSRHSRRILCSSTSDTRLRLVDNTFPNAPDLYSMSKKSISLNTGEEKRSYNKSNVTASQQQRFSGFVSSASSTITKDIPCIVVDRISTSSTHYTNNDNTTSLSLHVLSSINNNSASTSTATTASSNKKYPASITSNPHFILQDGTYSFLNTTLVKKKKKRTRKNATTTTTTATTMNPNKITATATDEIAIMQQQLQQHGYDNNSTANNDTEGNTTAPTITNNKPMNITTGRGRGRVSRGLSSRGVSRGGRGRMPRPGRPSLHNKQQLSNNAKLLHKNNKNTADDDNNILRVHSLIVSLPTNSTIVMSQIHPKDDFFGLCTLSDGSLVLFRLPLHSFDLKTSNNNTPSKSNKTTTNLKDVTWNHATIYYLHSNNNNTNNNDNTSLNNDYHITYATFDKTGTNIYASTKCSKLIGYYLPFPTKHKTPSIDHVIPTIIPSFIVSISPSTMYTVKNKLHPYPINSIQLSSNDTFILICYSHSSTFRLYNTNQFVFQKSQLKEDDDDDDVVAISPHAIFQPDVGVEQPNNMEWQCFDFSYNEEYIVAGCNITSTSSSSSDHYQLFLWHTNTTNTKTNTKNNTNIIHKLSGPPNVLLTNLSWHPHRPFIAISTSDGLIDIWGPSMDWTSFAPDFTPLQANVEYMEQEHEFDVVVDDVVEPKKVEEHEFECMETLKQEGDEYSSSSMDHGKEKVKKEDKKEKDNEEEVQEEDRIIDVVTIDKIPIFSSDSEDENDIFYFKTTKISNMVGTGRRGVYNKLPNSSKYESHL